MKRIMILALHVLLIMGACSRETTPPHDDSWEGRDTPLPDSCYTHNCIILIPDSTEAMKRIDEGVHFRKIALADARLLKAYRRIKNMEVRSTDDSVRNSITDDIREGMKDDSVRLVPRRRMLYLDFLINATNDVEAIDECREAITAAREVGDEVEEAYFTFIKYLKEFELEPTREKAIENKDNMLATIQTIEAANIRFRRLRQCYAEYFNMLVNVELFDDMVEAGESVLPKLPEMERNMDTFASLTYSSLACAYAALGRFDEGRKSYEKWLETKMARNPLGKINCFGYLVRSEPENVKTAVYLGHQFEPIIEKITDDSNMIGFYSDLALAHSRLGDYRTAYEMALKEVDAYDRLTINNIRQEGQKWAKKFELQEKDYELEQQRIRNRLAWIVAALSMLFVMVLCIAFYQYYRHSRQTKKKNKILARQLDQIEKYRTEVSQLRTSAMHRKDSKNAADAISDEELYEKMECTTNEQELFLTPKYPLADMAKVLEVSQARLLTFFKNSPDFGNLEDYLDMKRVVMACKILRTQPGQSMQAVCDLSGFTNTRQFNRKFKKYVSMTPSEYKNVVN